MTLGEQIRSAREKKNLSQETLAEQLGVSRQAVSKWENGTAVPQGANMAALIEILEMKMEKDEPISQQPDILRWLGWAVAGALLLSLIAVLILQFAGQHDPSVVPAEHAPATPEPETTPVETLPPEKREENPEISSVRFYSSTQEEVFSVMEEYLEFNTAVVEGILVQWSGETPLENAKMFFLPNNAANPSEAELLEVKSVAEGENAILFSAAYLHDEDKKGSVYFELCFEDGLTVSSSELYRVYYWEPYSQLVYVRDLTDGLLIYDRVEWVDIPSERANTLDLSPSDLSNGMFYIYNEHSVLETAPISEATVYWVLDWNSPSELIVDSQAAFLSNLEIYQPCLCELEIENGEIITITQRYLP